MNTTDDSQLSMSGRIRKFDEEHGGPAARVFFNAGWYFSDGSFRDGMPEGILQGPPKDSYTRLLRILYYHQGRLAEATRHFLDLKQLLITGSPSERELEKLKELQQVVRKCQAGVKQAERAWKETPEAKAQQGAKDSQAEETARRQEWMATLKEVNI